MTMADAEKTLQSLRAKAAPPSNAPPQAAPTTMKEIVQLDRKRQFPAMLQAFKSQIAVALPDHLTPDRMARLAMTAFNNNPQLALCEPNSVFAAVILSSQLGLEIGVDGEAFIVPYFDTKKQCYLASFIPGWKGYVKLVNQAEKATIWTGAVYKGDEFSFQLGDDPHCRHVPTGKCDETKANLTHVYSIGKINATGERIIEVWTAARVERHLAKFNKVGKRHYALQSDTNFIAYAKKVALLQVVKYVPKSVQLRAAQALERVGTNAVDLSDVIDGDWSNVSAAAELAGPDDGGTGEDQSGDTDQQQNPSGSTGDAGGSDDHGAAGEERPDPQQEQDSPSAAPASGPPAGRAATPPLDLGLN
jgi:recombination protein RecT